MAQSHAGSPVGIEAQYLLGVAFQYQDKKDEALAACRKAIHGLARKIGFLLPQPVTRDQEWNRAAYSAFMRRATNADTFDVSGKHDFADAQIALSKYHIRDGERLTVKALSKANRAMLSCWNMRRVGRAARLPLLRII
jgi:hypothetical protein